MPPKNKASDLIYHLATYGDGSDESLPCTNWNQGSDTALAVLSWLATEALQVRRLPWHPDYVFTKQPPNSYIELLKTQLLNDQEIADAISEVRRIYTNSQALLSQKYGTSKHLRRSIGTDGRDDGGLAVLILRGQAAAQYLGLNTFDIPVNTLSSWGGGNYSDLAIDIAADIPVADVLWTSETFPSRSERPITPAVESGEWIVVNRSLYGLMSIQTGSVTYNASGRNLSRLVNRISSSAAAERELKALRVLAPHQSYPHTTWYSGASGDARVSRTLPERLRAAWRAFSYVKRS